MLLVDNSERIASVPFHNHSVYLALSAAVLKGIGGASIIQESAQWAYVANTASPQWLSIFFSLIFILKERNVLIWMIPMRPIVGIEGVSSRFVAGFSCWVVYAVAAATLLQCGSPNLHASPDYAPRSFAEVARSIVDPIRLIFRNRTLTLLTVLFTLAAFAHNGCGVEWQLFRSAFKRLGRKMLLAVRF